MLQADAAAAAGCSVSVIRKWRRAGDIAERTRVSSGGMKRIEVRLADVLTKMQDTMPGRAIPGNPPLPVAASPATAAGPSDESAQGQSVVRPAELEVFVRHIAEAERRAAVAEAQLQANEVTMALLRERIDALQSQLEESPGGRTAAGADPAVGRLNRLVAEIREFRARFEQLERNGVRHDAQQRITARHTYDAALLSLCAAAGITTRFSLGSSLTPKDRAGLAKALSEIGLDVTT